MSDTKLSVLYIVDNMKFVADSCGINLKFKRIEYATKVNMYEMLFNKNYDNQYKAIIFLQYAKFDETTLNIVTSYCVASGQSHLIEKFIHIFEQHPKTPMSYISITTLPLPINERILF